tara:strand:+ start:896 stop:1198 length:303 start_codon:yes stop_codon:yes gene_type:complete
LSRCTLQGAIGNIFGVLCENWLEVDHIVRVEATKKSQKVLQQPKLLPMTPIVLPEALILLLFASIPLLFVLPYCYIRDWLVSRSSNLLPFAAIDHGIGYQ